MALALDGAVAFSRCDVIELVLVAIRGGTRRRSAPSDGSVRSAPNQSGEERPIHQEHLAQARAEVAQNERVVEGVVMGARVMKARVMEALWMT
jgi:hypothetical protein